MKRRTKADEVSMEEGQYRGIFEAAKDTFLIFDLEGVIREVNPAACEMYGYPYEEMIGLTGKDIVHPDYQHLFKEFVRKASEGRIFSAESVDIRKDGSSFDMEVRGSALTHKGEPHLLAVVRDVTERRRAEEEIRAANRQLRAAEEQLRASNQQLRSAERQVRMERDRYETLVNTIPDAVYSALPDESGTTTFMSGRWQAWTGYAPEDFYADHETWPKSIHPDDLERALGGYIRACREGKDYEETYRVVHKETGAIRWVRDRGVAVKDESGEVIRVDGVVTDITERREAGEALLESKRFLNNVIEQNPASLWISDAQGTMVRMNQACRDLFGVTDEEAVGTYNLFKDNLIEAQGFMPLVRDVFETGEVARFTIDYDVREVDHIDVKGATHRVLDVVVSPIRDTHGNVTNALVQHKDVTEITRAQERIEHLNLVLRAIRNVNQLITKEKDRGKLIQGACENLIENRGYYGAWIALLDASGKPDAAAEAGLGDEFRAMHEMLARGERVHCVRECLQKAGVQVIEHPPVTCGDCPLISKYETRSGMSVRLTYEGEVYGLMSVSIPARLASDPEELSLFGEVAGDIAFALHSLEREEERKRAEDEVRRLNRDLERRVAERTAELEAFAYSVSHDLRAPLRGMDGFSQALLEDYGDKLDATGKDYARRVRAASQRMGRLIDDILQLSRVTRHEMKRDTVDLSKLARATADKLRRRDPERQVTFAIQDGVVADGDAQLLALALRNLLGNAWKFTEGKPEARIAFGTVRNAACEAPKAELEDDAMVCFVRDNGAGFEMAYADKLFQPFQRLHTEADFPGTGIGLATVRRIVRRHGGRAWAKGAVGEGAVFYFTLGT